MSDFGFIGPSYIAPSATQEDQECINWYPEIDPLKAPGERAVVALYPTPGLLEYDQLNVAAVRALYAMSGGQWLIAVCGNIVYAISSIGRRQNIGILNTSTGYVSVSDNVTTLYGLTAYIVDGGNRYTWVADTNTFSTLPAIDGPWQGASVADVVDNYNVYNQPNTQLFAVTDLGSALSTNGYYGAKDGAPDSLVTLIVDHRQIFLLGERTSEVWVDVGNVIQGITSFPFQRVPGTMIQHGCAAAFSVARFSEYFMFVSKDDRGQGIIGAVVGYQFQRLSTHAVEYSLIGYDISDAKAFTYQFEGHEFYVVTFPQIDLTWVYDLTTKMWHKWLSVDVNNVYHRHRANCQAFFNGKNIVGDFQNGKLYTIEANAYTEIGNKIRRLRRAPHLVSDFSRQYFDELQIQFQPGVGIQGNITTDYAPNDGDLIVPIASNVTIGISQTVIIYMTYSINSETVGADPQAMLRWSNDGGATWSNEHWVSIGKIGRYKNRAIWRRLGMARDRIYEVVVTDPVKAAIISANLRATAGEN